MSHRVQVTVENGIADVRLDRPDKLNAIDADMFSALADAGRALGEDSSLRAVVLSGEGRAFCAGLDFSSFEKMASGAEVVVTLMARDRSSPANFAQRAGFIWRELPVPVIAAIHGVAFGGGLQIAAGADIRYIAPDARLSVMEINWGLIPDMSITQTLRGIVRLDVLKELAFTGRVVDGAEAVELGLATHLSATPFDDAMAAARDIAGRSPDAVRAAKRLFNEALVGSIADGLELEATLQRGLMGRRNQVEAVLANLERRPPVFQDPDS